MVEDISDVFPHLDEDLWSALSDLREKIHHARVIVSRFEPRDGLYLLDRTVTGLVDGARRHAEVFYDTALTGITDDLEHPRRFVLETVVDLFYLMLESNPHRTAARIAVWECRTADWIMSFVDRKDVGPPPPASYDLEGERIGSGQVRRLARLLEDPAEADLLLEQFDESACGRPAYHWTGKARFGERLRSLEGRMQRTDPDRAELLRLLFEFDWQVTSAGTHPRAGWADIVVETIDVDADPFSTERQVRLIQLGLEMLLKRAAVLLTNPPPER